MLGQSEALARTLALLKRYAACDAPVLIEGETGTGKELAAREIHYNSSRRDRPFVPVNCGALPDTLIESELFGHRRGAFTDAKSAQIGLVEHARGGSLFLDEVDSLSAKAQVTLLRFLQDSQYRAVGDCTARAADVRVIAASNVSLDQLSSDGPFRRDLFYRLNPLCVRLPPLRERGEDIVLLARHFLATSAQRVRAQPRFWTPEALQALTNYNWPGNVRELENVTLRACLHGEAANVGLAELAAVEPSLLAAEPSLVPAGNEPEIQLDPAGGSFNVAKLHAIHAFERSYLTALMRRTSGNVTEAARLSGTERRQLGKLLKKHGIEKTLFRAGAQ
jgi:DNA-binding NtrC family response regulator